MRAPPHGAARAEGSRVAVRQLLTALERVNSGSHIDHDKGTEAQHAAERMGDVDEAWCGSSICRRGTGDTGDRQRSRRASLAQLSRPGSPP